MQMLCYRDGSGSSLPKPLVIEHQEHTEQPIEQEHIAHQVTGYLTIPYC